MIVACPTCDSRYDATGRAPGEKLTCQCGTVITIAAAAPVAGMLACPHCGAGVAPTSSRCEHCSSDLLLKACPRCLSRCFAGNKHCAQCGAELDVAATGDTATSWPCPRCDHELRARLVGDVVIDECDGCHGVFLDHIAVRRIIEDRAQARAESVLGALPRKDPVHSMRPGERMYLKCPRCRAVMNRKLFAAGSGVIVDVCRAHGTFFDVGELPTIIEFVQRGGLGQAERRDLEQQREKLEHEKLMLSGSSQMRLSVQTFEPPHPFADLLAWLLR